MYWFRNYRALLDSHLIDKFIFKTIISRHIIPFLIWHYYDNIILFLLPVLSIYLRGEIENSFARWMLTYSSILISWVGQAYFWTALLISIELIRFILIYGVPFLLRRANEEMARDPIGETAFRRILCLLKKIRSSSMEVIMNEYVTIYESYNRQDSSESFTPKEREQFDRLFRDFSQTVMIVDDMIGVVLFFPSFIVRFNSSGIHFDSESAMKLIEPIDTEPCPICQEISTEPCIELSCRHCYCLKCIIRWLQEQEQCPLCRNPVG